MSELIIHAEGGTTNGKMISFKKGAFAALLSVRPRGVKYNTYCSMTSSSGILDGLPHHMLQVALILGCILEIFDFPIFRPNEYFWQHH